MATFCRPNFTPSKSEEGLTGSLPSSKFEDSIGFYDGIEEEFSQEDLKALDSEGRCVITCHQIEVKRNDCKTSEIQSSTQSHIKIGSDGTLARAPA